MIDNYVRLMQAGRAKVILSFDSDDHEQIERVLKSVQKHGIDKAVIWRRIPIFSELDEVGEMRAGAQRSPGFAA